MAASDAETHESTFEDLSITELQERAELAGLTGIEGLNKRDLIIALRNRN